MSSLWAKELKLQKETEIVSLISNYVERLNMDVYGVALYTFGSTLMWPFTVLCKQSEVLKAISSVEFSLTNVWFHVFVVILKFVI